MLFSKFPGNIIVRWFSDNITWVKSLEAGLQQIQEAHKPGFLVIHRSTCGACLKLKENIKASQETKRKSRHFVCISLTDDEASVRTKTYAPDGAYVPRILFIAPISGNVLVDITNPEASDEYKYFYSDVEPLIQNMDKVLKRS